MAFSGFRNRISTLKFPLFRERGSTLIEQNFFSSLGSARAAFSAACGVPGNP
jgi:hypothetical protein